MDQADVHKAARTFTKLNGSTKPALLLTRVVKQGDPISALLFVLTIEPLVNLLLAHEEHGECMLTDHTATSTFLRGRIDAVCELCRSSTGTTRDRRRIL